jgi:hypothetical protein
MREEINRLMLNMQREEKGIWRYEWPMKQKEKWPIQQMISIRQKKKLRRWLRHAKTLSATEEDMVYICEPEVGKNLSDEEER